MPTTRWIQSITVATALLVLPALSQPVRPQTEKPNETKRTLTMEQFEDKVRGGWAGQMIGVTYGAPDRVPIHAEDQ